MVGKTTGVSNIDNDTKKIPLETSLILQRSFDKLKSYITNYLHEKVKHMNKDNPYYFVVSNFDEYLQLDFNNEELLKVYKNDSNEMDDDTSELKNIFLECLQCFLGEISVPVAKVSFTILEKNKEGLMYGCSYSKGSYIIRL